MGKKFLAVFLILISILSFSSCSMDSLTDFMKKMGDNIVPYDDTKAKKAAEETNLSSSDVNQNATVTGGKVNIGGVDITLEDNFTLEEKGGMLKPLEDSERKEVVNTLYNAVVTLNPKDKETVVAEKAKPAPEDVQNRKMYRLRQRTQQRSLSQLSTNSKRLSTEKLKKEKSTRFRKSWAALLLLLILL